MSTPISIRNIHKRYGDVVIIPDLSVDVQAGEFFTLLGPSGCGKTTMLRMIAGFIEIERGTVSFGDKIINDVPVHRRDYGMVFQNYAIFPSMTVEGNVAFGLENRKVSKADAEPRIVEMLTKVRMEHLRKRHPENLSGGQQQRIALARAIVIRPKVLLMDEPLSNLDAKLRVEIREVIADIQREVGITTIYVTHDQEEALSVSDRIAVMNLGQIQQVDAPEAIYRRPYNLFVANFIGTSNVFKGVVTGRTGATTLITLDNGYALNMHDVRQDVENGRRVVVSVRPENIKLRAEPTGLSGTVVLRQFLGSHVQYNMESAQQEHFAVSQNADFDTALHEIGAGMHLDIDGKAANIFDEETSITLMTGVESNVVDPAQAS